MKILGIVAVDVVRESPKIFRAPICRAHCAVIFAIAQLSCIHIVALLLPVLATDGHLESMLCISSSPLCHLQTQQQWEPQSLRPTADDGVYGVVDSQPLIGASRDR